MRSRALLLVVAAAVLASLCSFLLDLALPRSGGPGGLTPRGARMVSLSPALTDTLFAIGAGAQVVGVSDYCDYPPEARTRPRVGSGLLPSYERIAVLDPTLILAEASSAPRLDALSTIAETRLLPWLGADQMVAGVRSVGSLSGARDRAETLARELETRLSRTPPDDAIQILLLFGSIGLRSDQLWFARPSSLHSRVLAAAGARNAIREDRPGPPVLGLERLLALDPEAIVVLTDQPGAAAGAVDDLRQLSALRAARSGMVAPLESPAAFSTGPRILVLIDQLAAVIARLEATR